MPVDRSAILTHDSGMTKNASKTRPDGMPVGTPFTSDHQPEGRGRPKGSLSLGTRIRALLEGDDDLPPAVLKEIKKAVGSDRAALDAVIIQGLRRALWGSEKWAKLLLEMGYGKPDQVSKVELTGKEGEPLSLGANLTDDQLRAIAAIVTPKVSSGV